MSREDAARWAAGLEGVMERIEARFGRVEPRRRALAYLRGLLSPIERKNGWPLAETAGDRTPDGMQDFLARVHWDADRVGDDLRASGVEHLGDAQAVLVLDETGFVKKGAKSCGVQRQYSGTAGRIENCQIGVFLSYASRSGQALIDRALYLPESWASDPQHRAAAGVPETITFATKPKRGRALLERAFATGVPCAWVVGDSVYGADHALRRGIEQPGRGHVLTVTSAQRLGLKPVADWLEDGPATADTGGGWQRLSAGDGAKGPRLHDGAYLPDRGDAAAGWQKGLLIRCKIKKPEAFTFCLTLAPTGTPLAELVRVAGARWTVESCFATAKGEGGLDHYAVRLGTGWHRHITLAMLAHAYLAVLRKTAAGSGGKTGTGRQHRARLTAGVWSGHIRPTPNAFSPGRCGDAGTSSAPVAAIGNGEPTPMKPGCSTRTARTMANSASASPPMPKLACTTSWCTR